MRGWEPPGMDRSGDGEEETQTVLEVPDAGTGERVSVQCVRFETEALGAGEKSESDGAAGEDLVPEQADEEQKKLPETGGAAAEQQQLGY